MFFRNVGCNLTDYTASYLRRCYSSSVRIFDVSDEIRSLHLRNTSIVRPLYGRGYVIPCVGNLTEEKFSVSLNVPGTYECQKYVESIILIL
jgi:hypothetical protein